MGVWVYLAMLPVTYFAGGLQPSDAPLFVLMLLAYLALDADKPYWLLPIIGVGIFFHETIFWVVILSAIVWWPHVFSLKRTGWLAGMTALWAAGYFGLRALMPYEATGLDFWVLPLNLTSIYAYVNTAVVLSPLLLLDRAIFKSMPRLAQRGLIMMPIMLLLICQIGQIRESRLLMVLFPALIALILTVYEKQKSASQPGEKWLSTADLRPAAFLALMAAGTVSLMHTHLFAAGFDNPTVITLFESHNIVIAGQRLTPTQTGLLGTWFSEMVYRAGFPLHYATTITRYLFTVTGILALYALLKTWMDRADAIIGCLGYLALMPITLAAGGLQPSAAPLFTLITLGYLALAKNKPGWLLPIMAVGVFVHESILWLVLIAALVWGRESLKPRRLLLLGGMAAVWAVGYIGIRAELPYTVDGALITVALWEQVSVWLRPAMLLTFAPLLLLNRQRRSALPIVIKRIVIMAPLAAGLFLLHGWAYDPAPALLLLPAMPVILQQNQILR